jgi:hypothetical protein
MPTQAPEAAEEGPIERTELERTERMGRVGIWSSTYSLPIQHSLFRPQKTMAVYAKNMYILANCDSLP